MKYKQKIWETKFKRVTNNDIKPFNRLVKLMARAFYDDITIKGYNQPKTGRSDNGGIAVVVLDALTRREWVREEDLAKDLKMHSKQLRRTLRFFEEEKLVTRDHRKEAATEAKIFSAAIAAIGEGQLQGKEGEEKIKLHTHSYCCLDYVQIFDVVRYKLHWMKKKLKNELEDKNTVQEYICPNCGRRYNALDALSLISLEDEFFLCENCNRELIAESDKLVAQEGGEGDDNVRRRRREKLKDMLQKMEVQLKLLMEQLDRVKDLPVPEFGNLQAWEARASAAVGETKVEVVFSGAEDLGEDEKIEGGSAAAAQVLDDKKSTSNGDDDKNFQDEYVKAYYAAILEKQQELEAAQQENIANASISVGFPSTSSDRQVGMKSKRGDTDEDEWEVDQISGNGRENYKVNDLDIEVDASGDDEEEDDDVDWEEG